jgi:DNA-binding NarL/FixJ family response regulator
MMDRTLSSLASFLDDTTWHRLADQLRFSTRELQIVRAIFADEKEAAIARSLQISPHTVHTHIERLYAKLQIASRVQLVVTVLTELLVLTSRQNTPLKPICFHRIAGDCPFNAN